MDTCVHTVHVAVTVLTWLSGIMCFIVIVMELSRKKIRQFPGNLPLIFSAVALCFNMSLGVGPTVQFRQVTQFEESDFWHTICIGQSILYQFCGISTLYWYCTLSAVMYSIIVNHTRVHDLRASSRKYYLWGFIIPTISSVVPGVFGVYTPRTGEIECWIDNPWWQFGFLYLWVFLGAVYGANRSYKIVKVLRRTAYKTTLHTKSSIAGQRGRTVLHTLKEHLVRQVCFIFLYVIFACINLVYFAWSSMLDRDPDPHTIGKDPCVLSMLYGCNTSLIGAYIALVFGVTRENIKTAKGAWRRVVSSTTGRGMGGRTNDGTYDEEAGKSDLTQPLVKGERGEMREVTREEVVTTHLGTKIDARLGIIQSPRFDCSSKFSVGAVSGTSMPPLHHPMISHLESMRMQYTTNVLAYVLERIEVLAVDEGIGKEFMEAITTESHRIFSVGGMRSGGRLTSREGGNTGGTGDNYGLEFDGNAPWDSVDGGCDQEGRREESEEEYLRDSEGLGDIVMPTEEDLDERLKRAKERFEEILAREKKG